MSDRVEMFVRDLPVISGTVAILAAILIVVTIYREQPVTSLHLLAFIVPALVCVLSMRRQA